jgi:hypothetical protein
MDGGAREDALPIDSTRRSCVFLPVVLPSPYRQHTSCSAISMFILIQFLSSTCVSLLTISPCKRGKPSPPGLFLDHSHETTGRLLDSVGTLASDYLTAVT